MKRFLIYLSLSCIVFAEFRNWDAHSAHLIPQKRWEMGLFQPFRYGYSENLEYSVHPVWFFVVPNFIIKKSQNPMLGFTTASRYKIFYPTPLLNMVAKKGIFGIISPEFQIPPLLGLSASWLMSKDMAGLNTTFTGGVDLGIAFGELDSRSSIDLPLLYHRLGVYYNTFGVHVGFDAQKNLLTKVVVFSDLDYRLLPGLNGDYSLEHKLLISWEKSDRFRILMGYKFVVGAYPYGFDTHVLPYVPMMEKWVPIIEFQWAGKKK